MNHKYKAAIVKWVDSHEADGWSLLSDRPERPAGLPITTLGWLIDETDDALTITAHLAYEPEQCCGLMTIPKLALLSVVEVQLDTPAAEERTPEAENKVEVLDKAVISRPQCEREGLGCRDLKGITLKILRAATALTGIVFQVDEGKNEKTDPHGETIVIRRAE